MHFDNRNPKSANHSSEQVASWRERESVEAMVKKENVPSIAFQILIIYKSSPNKIVRGVTVFFQRELCIQINVAKICSIFYYYVCEERILDVRNGCAAFR